MRIKLLVFGKSGQVATELARRMPQSFDVQFLGRQRANLLDADACADAIRSCSADAVVNAAAYTAVDEAERHFGPALRINGEAPAAMAEACASRKIPFIHLSTDYVFDGNGQSPFKPIDQPRPINNYGRSKLIGENGIRDKLDRHVIIRTSWIVSSHGNNFVKTILRLAKQKESIRVVSDQIGCPTPASAIADAIYVTAERTLDRPNYGIFHFTGHPETNWSNVARTIVSIAKIPCKIEGIPTESYPSPAKRPLNSRLDCSSFLETFGVTRPDWRESLTEILKELGASTS